MKKKTASKPVKIAKMAPKASLLQKPFTISYKKKSFKVDVIIINDTVLYRQDTFDGLQAKDSKAAMKLLDTKIAEFIGYEALDYVTAI